MALKVREIDHLVLRTTDMPRALRFYADVLGCHEERRLDDISTLTLSYTFFETEGDAASSDAAP